MKKADKAMLAIYFLMDIGYVYTNFEGLGTNMISHIFVWVTAAVLARMLFLLWKKQKNKTRTKTTDNINLK